MFGPFSENRHKPQAYLLHCCISTFSSFLFNIFFDLFRLYTNIFNITLLHVWVRIMTAFRKSVFVFSQYISVCIFMSIFFLYIFFSLVLVSLVSLLPFFSLSLCRASVRVFFLFFFFFSSSTKLNEAIWYHKETTLARDRRTFIPKKIKYIFRRSTPNTLSHTQNSDKHTRAQKEFGTLAE